MKLGVKYLFFATLSVACATTGAAGQGDLSLPSAGMGPFRKLAADEVPGVAPFVLDDHTALYRDPAALADGDATLLYVVATRAAGDVIVRTRALDGRSFFGTTGDSGHTPAKVLAADAAWEGPSLTGPFALRWGGEILLYYAALGGLGVARSTDGLTFTKEAGPILAHDGSSSWETTELAAPSAYVTQSGKVRVLYASGSSIGEAESDDGVHFQRIGTRPILVPSEMPASLDPGEKPPFDTARVGDPCVSTTTTPAGRFDVRVLYTGEAADGTTSIGLAARYGDDGPLTKNDVAVYAGDPKNASPAYLATGAGFFLYVQEERTSNDVSYSAIAAAFAPGDVHLPTPADFPDAP